MSEADFPFHLALYIGTTAQKEQVNGQPKLE
jgi:hypothetical protein